MQWNLLGRWAMLSMKLQSHILHTDYALSIIRVVAMSDMTAHCICPQLILGASHACPWNTQQGQWSLGRLHCEEIYSPPFGWRNWATYTLKMTAFWDKAPCSLIEVVYFTETTQHYIPESCHLHTCHCENLKSHNMYYLLNLRAV
jgi:hypothetical protein